LIIDEPLDKIDAGVLTAIQEMLVQDESRYQREHGSGNLTSLWSHSVRVARIAHHLALKEAQDPVASILASLLHDAGKFHGGVYHQDDVAEEERAVIAAREILSGTPHAPLLPHLEDAVLSLYREDVEATGIGAVLHDADRLDKLGNMGIAQFFTKNALRGTFLDNRVMVKASIELTYAHHAPRTLKTETGQGLAHARSARVRSFFEGLLEEWKELDLGAFSIQDFDAEGILLVLVVPDTCSCTSKLTVDLDIRESLKCRSAVVAFGCKNCRAVNTFSFCLPCTKPD